MNLRKQLEELKSHLEKTEGYLPSSPPKSPEFKAAIAITPNTQVITDFESFLNDTPQAVQFLKDRGINWPASSPDDDLDLGDIKLGPACSTTDPGCESCQ